MIGVGFQKQLHGSHKQETGLPGDFAKVAANSEHGSSLVPRTTGQRFAQRPTVHNNVYNPLLAEGLRIGNIIQN